MAKKQKSFADKAAGSGDKDAVYVKYVNSVRSKKTGHWRFNEQMVKTKKGESLDVALKRLDEAANLSDIDLTKFAKVVLPEPLGPTIAVVEPCFANKFIFFNIFSSP